MYVFFQMTDIFWMNVLFDFPVALQQVSDQRGFTRLPGSHESGDPIGFQRMLNSWCKVALQDIHDGFRACSRIKKATVVNLQWNIVNMSSIRKEK